MFIVPAGEGGEEYEADEGEDDGDDSVELLVRKFLRPSGRHVQ
jgi:hypothetical protein